MQILKITVLWIAGTLVLGHGIIPHHHHDEKQDRCAEDSKNHNHEISLNFADNCCQNNKAHNNICSLDQRTLVKDYQVPFAALVNVNFKLSISENCSNSQYNNFRLNIITEVFRDESPSRAPPMA